MKNRKRNLTMLAVLMFVCAAVVLNWTYNNRWGKPDAEMVYAEDQAMLEADTDFADSLLASGTEYFAEARLTRQVSRDEALELLQTAPCRRFGIDTGDDFTVFDLGAEYTVDPESFISKGHSTPVAGRSVKGRCLCTVSGGRTAYLDEGFSELLGNVRAQ